MSYYANSEERAGLIAGLRDLAQFLDQNPDVPAPRWADLLVFPPVASNVFVTVTVPPVPTVAGATELDVIVKSGFVIVIGFAAIALLLSLDSAT